MYCVNDKMAVSPIHNLNFQGVFKKLKNLVRALQSLILHNQLKDAEICTSLLIYE